MIACVACLCGARILVLCMHGQLDIKGCNILHMVQGDFVTTTDTYAHFHS